MAKRGITDVIIETLDGMQEKHHCSDFEVYVHSYTFEEIINEAQIHMPHDRITRYVARSSETPIAESSDDIDESMISEGRMLEMLDYTLVENRNMGKNDVLICCSRALTEGLNAQVLFRNPECVQRFTVQTHDEPDGFVCSSCGNDYYVEIGDMIRGNDKQKTFCSVQCMNEAINNG